jgi:hypothetical protein
VSPVSHCLEVRQPCTRYASSALFWLPQPNAAELAHQWAGNLVTMAWWDALWLNEGNANMWVADGVGPRVVQPSDTAGAMQSTTCRRRYPRSRFYAPLYRPRMPLQVGVLLH